MLVKDDGAVEVKEEGKEEDPSQETVDVTPPAKAEVPVEDQLAAKIRADFETLYGSRLKQSEDRLHGAYRIQEKLQREIDSLKTQLSKPPPAPVSTTDPWGGIENGQVWKAEVEKLAEQKAEAKLNEWHTRQEQQTALAVQQQTLDASKRAVIAKYPDLDPEAGNPETPISKAYVAVLAEHPDWLANSYGPTLAMYAMEEKLKASATAGGSGKSRLATATLTPSRPVSPGGERMILTREQKAFCDRNQIKYEDYIKTAAALEAGAVEA